MRRKKKGRLASGLLLNMTSVFDQAAASAAAFFRFLRQPSRPNSPRPPPKSGRAAGSRLELMSAAVTPRRIGTESPLVPPELVMMISTKSCDAKLELRTKSVHRLGKF